MWWEAHAEFLEAESDGHSFWGLQLLEILLPNAHLSHHGFDGAVCWAGTRKNLSPWVSGPNSSSPPGHVWLPYPPPPPGSFEEGPGGHGQCPMSLQPVLGEKAEWPPPGSCVGNNMKTRIQCAGLACSGKDRTGYAGYDSCLVKSFPGAGQKAVGRLGRHM